MTIQKWTKEKCAEYIQAHGTGTALWDAFWTDSQDVHPDELQNAEQMMTLEWKKTLFVSFCDRFINRERMYFEQWVSGGKLGYARREGATRAAILEHIDRRKTISLPAISELGYSRWCCFDSDTTDGSIGKIKNKLIELKFHPVLEGQRPGRDGHLWIFFDEPVHASGLIAFRNLINEMIPLDTIEFFPKSETACSQVRLPLGVHRKPGADGCIGWFTGVEPTLENQLSWLSEQPMDSSIELTNMVEWYQKQCKPEERIKHPITFNKSYQSDIVDFRQVFSGMRRIGKDYAAPCPVCQSIGMDKTGDNLRISTDGKQVNCVTNGINSMHSTEDIYNWYRNQRVS